MGTQATICSASHLMIFIFLTNCGQPAHLKNDNQLQSQDGEIHQDDSCAADTIKSVSVSNYPDHRESKRFNFKYEYLAGKSPSLNPTVIFLQGGPGSPSIGEGRLGIPDNFNVVLTDLRGIGCNTQAAAGELDVFYDVDYLVNDLITLIQHLELNEYYIYGVSYGTALATEVAGELKKRGIKTPKALILEGVLGRAFNSKAELYGSYSSEWEHTLLQQDPKIVDIFRSESSPLGILSKKWGSFISTLLIFGPQLSEEGLPINYLDMFLPYLVGDEIQKNELIKFVDKVTTDNIPSPAEDRLYRYVACTHITDLISGIDGEDMEIFRGSFIPVTGSLCQSLKLAEDRYDAKHNNLEGIDIVYFSGTRDPATPPWQADYHFKSQPDSRRVLISVIDAGHGPLISSNLNDCKTQIWQTIGREIGSLPAVIDQECSWQTKIETAEANAFD